MKLFSQSIIEKYEIALKVKDQGYMSPTSNHF